PAPLSSPTFVASSSPQDSSAVEIAPAAPATLKAAAKPATITEARESRKAAAQQKYSTSHQVHPPIVVNNFPSSFAPWSPEDQYQMSKWNYYASNIFRVFITPTGVYGWPDGVFDLAGWPSSADMERVYGYPWPSNVLGGTFTRWDGWGWIIE